jgi:alkaline phosphatase
MPKIRIHHLGLLLTILSAWPAAASPAKTSEQSPKAKYIFLMIGDGMGQAQCRAAEMFKRHRASSTGDARLIFNQFPVKGTATTHSSNAKITDSAAAVTALACGEKTCNGVLAMRPDKQTRLKSIAFDAREAGLKVGIVTSVALDHATPAGFYACSPSRNLYYDIAAQVAQSDFNYFAGRPFAGVKSQFAQNRPSPRKLAREAGYTLYKDAEGLKKIRSGADKVIWEAWIPQEIDRQPCSLTLADLTRKGIEVLDGDQGFFMMVEGGMIDWTGHANDLAANIRETLAFDDAVAEAYEFYRRHPAETLILVTADHETGGMKTAFGEGFSPSALVKAVEAQKVSGAELAKMSKTWTEATTSLQEVLRQVRDLFGLQHLTADELAQLERAAGDTLKYKRVDERPPELKEMYGGRNMLAMVCQTIVARRCAVEWTSFGHSSAAVGTMAIGPGTELFQGKIDNTDVAKKLRRIISLSFISAQGAKFRSATLE